MIMNDMYNGYYVLLIQRLTVFGGRIFWSHIIGRRKFEFGGHRGEEKARLPVW